MDILKRAADLLQNSAEEFESPDLSYKVPLRCGDVNLFKSAFKQYEETLVSQGWTVVYTEVHRTEGNIAILVS